MRIRIIFKLRNKGATLPFQHQHLLLKLVEQLLQGTDFERHEGLIYNFSGLKGQIKVSRAGLSYLSSRVTLVLSSVSEAFINVFTEQLFKHKLLEVGEVILTPEFTEEEPIMETKTAMKYLCLSPLIPSLALTEEQATLLSTETMSDMLYDSTMYRMEKSGLYKASEIEQFYQFQLIPDKDYLQKLLLEDKKAARSYFLYEKGEVANELIGYTFPFQLYAHPKVQEFIFLAGFGEATNQGYGMLDVVRTSVEDAKKVIKTPDYKLENSTRIEKNKMFNPLVSVYNMFR